MSKFFIWKMFKRLDKSISKFLKCTDMNFYKLNYSSFSHKSLITEMFLNVHFQNASPIEHFSFFWEKIAFSSTVKMSSVPWGNKLSMFIFSENIFWMPYALDSHLSSKNRSSNFELKKKEWIIYFYICNSSKVLWHLITRKLLGVSEDRGHYPFYLQS